MHRHKKDIVYRGASLAEADKAMVMIHGRGATPESILGMASYLSVEGFALLAPKATNNTWYPNSFMAPVESNEPGLSSALEVLAEVVKELEEASISTSNIYWLGFSQGACLASEFVARSGKKFGGLFVYSGGLIGAELNIGNYSGGLDGMPTLIACSDTDPHIPLHRVKETVTFFTESGANVTERIYPNGAHTIYEDEIERTNVILENSRANQ